LGKNGENVIHSSGTKIEIGKAVTVNEGKDLSIITTSNMLEEGVKLVQKYKETGKMAALISMPTIKPLDKEYILKLIDRKVPIITLEEHSIIGGLGSAVAEIIAESGKGVPFRRIGIQDEYSHYIGSQQYLRNKLVEIDTIYY